MVFARAALLSQMRRHNRCVDPCGSYDRAGLTQESGGACVRDLDPGCFVAMCVSEFPGVVPSEALSIGLPYRCAA